MKKIKKLLLITCLISITIPITYQLIPKAKAHECATCSGTGTCNACKNCKYCTRCSKDGKTCSVCK